MINNFEFYNKTRLIFGKDTETEVGKNVKQYSDKCLVHYDGGDHMKPILDRVRKSLTEAGVEIIELGGVEPNPKLSLIRKGIELCKEEDIGFVLAVGGGSVMDSAKFIAFGIHHPGDVWTYQSFTPVDWDVVPMGCISTLPGTGSEFSQVSMVVNDEGEYDVKALFGHPTIKFDFAIINPELFYTLPAKQTAAGAFDIIAHLTENYFGSTTNADAYEGYIFTGVNTVIRNVKNALANPTDYDARANLALASIMPMSFLTSGVVPDMCVHNIEKPMTTTYKQTHGEMLGILTIAWMKYCYKRDLPKFTSFAVQCMGAKMNYENPEETILEGIDRLEKFVADIGLATRLSQVGITSDEKFGFCADIGLFHDRNNTIGNVSKLTYDQILEVYNIAL